MRKYAAIFCAMALTVGLCACGKDDAPADTKPSVTTTTAATTTTAGEGVKTPLRLTYASDFSDGVALVRYVSADGTETAAAINTAGDILFHLPADVPVEGEGYRNGIRVVGNLMYDKTGAVIASPELSGYDALMTGNCGGYVLAKKVTPVAQPAPAPESVTTTAAPTTAATTAAALVGDTTTTTGVTVDIPTNSAATLSIGVLNDKGEWVHPLSEEHPLAVAITAAA